MKMHLFPTEDQLVKIEGRTPEYMHPNRLPLAVIGEGYLLDEQCDAILDEMNALEPYSFSTCGAETRQCPRPLSSVLDPIMTFAHTVNMSTWNYELDDDGAAWLQTYGKGAKYPEHMDSVPGQSRKLSAVAFMSEPVDYIGGALEIYAPPMKCTVPSTRGTIVAFPSYLVHEVLIVSSGIRQTINLGLWGPSLR